MTASAGGGGVCLRTSGSKMASECSPNVLSGPAEAANPQAPSGTEYIRNSGGVSGNAETSNLGSRTFSKSF